MSRVAYLWDARCLEHDNAPHVESAQRAERLSPDRILPRAPNAAARPASSHDAERWIETVHTPEYRRWVAKACHGGARVLDEGDTVVGKRSYEAALAAVDAALTAADAVATGQARRAFCAIRPPGHHALPTRAMGFCLFGNVSIVARYLQGQHGVGRIAVVDWDVHHGNGTQDIFYADGSVLFVSLHQHPLWPGTGLADEAGEAAGRGATLNCPIAPGTPEADYLATFESMAVPAVDRFAPEFILISAGFDAHERDPLGGLRLTESGFGRLTTLLRELADRHCGGRMVSCLEGGYDLDALEASVIAHVTALGG